MSCVPKNCNTCAFKYMVNKGVTPYCALKRFPILNPEIGCSRHMYESEFKSGKYSSMLYVSADEIQAATEARKINEEF